MKRFLGFVRKEWYHILRDPRTLLILFGMPVAQILLFGYAVTNEIKEAKIAIHDPARDEVSRELTQKLLASGYFVLDHHIESEATIEESFQKGEIKMVVSYPPDLAQKLRHDQYASIQLLADAADPNTANTLVNYASQIFSGYQPVDLPIRIDLDTRMRYNPQLKGVFLFVPGLITIILMLISTMMTSISIAREKEMGTMEVLLVSPMRPLQIIMGKVTPYVLLAMLDAVLIVVLGYFVFEVPMVGSLWFLAAESLLFVLAALALGILISTVAKTQQVALLISLMGLLLPTILLSGFMFPIENMPLVLQAISNLIPARWFIAIIKGIMLQGLGLEMVWKETLILLGFTMFFLIASVKRFQVRLE